MTSRILLPLLLALAACGEDPPPPAAKPAPPLFVRTAPVAREARAKPVVATGLLASKAERKASFKLGGLIASITVDEGAQVRRGQVLATLRATEVEAAVEQARQGVAKAERDLSRAQTLFDGNAATREQLDDATTGAAIARSQLRAAEFNREHAVIRATTDGRVLRRLAEPNELVGPGQPVLVLSGDSAGWVLRAALADRDAVRVSQGTPAEVTLSAWPLVPLAGKLSELASAATPLGTYEVEVALTEDPRAPLRSGMIGKLRLSPPTTELVALIPAVALRDGQGERATVWSLRGDGGVTRHRVRVAFFLDDQVAIAEGLDGVTEVVTDGAPYLNERSRVQLAPAPATEASAAKPASPTEASAAKPTSAANAAGGAL